MRLLLLFCIVFAQTTQAGKIALSFDDSPTWDSHYLTGPERTDRLIKALRRAGVEQAMFFANTVRVEGAGEQRLRALANAGHLIANHSHSHQSAGRLSVDDYVAEVEMAHKILNNLPGFTPFHRFPYLNRGKGASEVAEIHRRLAAMGYNDGYVTVDNFDFYISHLFNEAVANGKSLDTKKLEALYVDTLWQAITFYDELAWEYIGRSPKHVLLLHENDAAVLFIEALVDKIRAEGWEIIPVLDAYDDSIAEWFDAQSIHGQGRIAAIASQRGASEDRMRHPMESTQELEEAFSSVVLDGTSNP